MTNLWTLLFWLALCGCSPLNVTQLPPATGDPDIGDLDMGDLDTDPDIGSPCLWRIEGPQGPTYLLGTAQLGESAEEALPPVVWDRLREAESFLVTADIRGASREEVLALTLLPRDMSIQRMLPTDVWLQLREFLPGQVTPRQQPWFVVSLIRAQLSPGKTPMELELFEFAKESGKPMTALEDWTDQPRALRESLTAQDVVCCMENSEQLAEEMQAAAEAYRSGDLKQLERLTFHSQCLSLNPRYLDLFYYQRNQAWLAKILATIPQGGTVVVVKVGHLLEEQGLLHLLQGRGHPAKRVREVKP